MRTLLLAAAMLIAGPAVAYDEKINDYTACLIGQTVMALNAQGDKKDIEAAYSALADKKCPPPEGFNDETVEAENVRESVGDFVNYVVLAVGKGVWGVDL